MSYTSTSITRFASVADFVGDAPRVFIFSTATLHPASVDTATAGTTTHAACSCDTLGRLTRLSTQLTPGGSELLTFTA